jgi:KaiC/GvpD/RAD55 family RecA-like ATPase
LSQKVQFEKRSEDRRDAEGAPSNSAKISSGVQLFKSLLQPQVRTILVRGEPGTGKTTLAIDLLSQYGKGLYVSTRVSEHQLSLQNPTVDKLLKEGLVKEISIQQDFNQGSFNFADFRLAAVEDILQAIISSSSGAPSEPLIVLDSWDTIAKKLDLVEKMRTEQSLLVIAEANHARLLFVSEEIGLTSTDYIVDAVVQLEDTIFEGRRLRQIIWKKLRGSSIPQRSYLYSLDGGRFNVLEDSFVPWPEPFGTNSFRALPDGPFYYSSGSKELDAFLGGGFRRGSLVLIELGKHLGDYWHVPIVRSVEMNFIANDGCTVVIPMGNFPPEMIKEEFLRFFSGKVLRNSLRIVHRNSRETDPCFLKLASASVDSRASRLTRNIRAMKGRQNRPCCYFVGSDMIEGLLGDAASMKSVGPTLSQGMKYTGDLTLLAVREGSPMINEMMNSCDLHLKLDDVDNTLLLYSVKPRSELYHVKYDYGEGCPGIGLVPVV